MANEQNDVPPLDQSQLHIYTEQAEHTTPTLTRVNKKKRSDKQQQDVGSSANRSKQSSTLSADNINRCTNQQIRINMISNTKNTFYCTVCPSVYLDRTGLYYII